MRHRASGPDVALLLLMLLLFSSPLYLWRAGRPDMLPTALRERSLAGAKVAAWVFQVRDGLEA